MKYKILVERLFRPKNAVDIEHWSHLQIGFSINTMIVPKKNFPCPFLFVFSCLSISVHMYLSTCSEIINTDAHRYIIQESIIFFDGLIPRCQIQVCCDAKAWRAVKLYIENMETCYIWLMYIEVFHLFCRWYWPQVIAYCFWYKKRQSSLR